MKPATSDHNKPLKATDTKTVGLAVVRREVVAGREVAQCSCGTTMWHSRSKVLEDRVDRHIDKKHGGRGIRL